MKILSHVRTYPRWCIGDASAHIRGPTIHRQMARWCCGM